MQTELKNLVEAVRDGRGVEAAMLAAQVQLLLANNPGKATVHDPATAGPDDLTRRVHAAVEACAGMAPITYSWAEVESVCKAVILAIAAVGDGRVPFAANPKPVMPILDAGGMHTQWCPCEHCASYPEGWRTVEIKGKQYTLDENARPKNDADIALLARTWNVTVQELNEALGRVPDNPKPVGPPTVLVDGYGKTAWHPYPEECPTIPGEYQVQLRSGEYTWRATTAQPCSFPKPLDPMNAVVGWLG